MCVVVELPDHHCGDDLVFLFLLFYAKCQNGVSSVARASAGCRALVHRKVSGCDKTLERLDLNYQILRHKLREHPHRPTF